MPHRILIVDDDQDLREMMAVLLIKDGFETEVAADGQEALDKARAHPPNVIVLDMKLPVMDGWTFRAHQRYDEVLAPIPVVLLTAVPLARLTNVGAAAALQKPFDYQQFIATVRACC
jgi:two-component system chemotaxis response regulator CheY